ncbi:hypothetical protein LPJ74_004040 [Coemansia sp. RSA 1843]|nr:hypothetical protein LPJ74_004040 [Coemansia sp. RSA 1843]
MPSILPSKTKAFAYRPYMTTSEATHLNSQYDWDNNDSDDSNDKTPNARIVGRPPIAVQTAQSLDNDRAQMAQLHAGAMTARIREAKRILDDVKFEYSCDVLYECQRGLHPMDPPPWCDSSMKLTLPNVHSFQLPDPSWQWVSPRWLIDMTLDVDDDGWQYSSRFGQPVWHGRHSATRSFVRRRRWLRLRRRPRTTQTVDAVNAPGASLVVELQPTLNESKRRSKKPILIANKFKNKVSGGYVGTCPKSPTKPEAKPLAYTLKDGRYRSHHLKAVDSYAMEVAARVLSCPASPVNQSSPASPTTSSRKNVGPAKALSFLAPSSLLKLSKLEDGNIPGTRIPYSRISNIGAIAEEAPSDDDKDNIDSDDEEEEEASEGGFLTMKPTVPSFNIIGSSPSTQDHRDAGGDQSDTIQQLKRCLSENWQKRDLRRTPASSLRLCVQRDDSDSSDNEDDSSKSGTGSWAPGNRLPLPTIIDKHTGNAVSMCVPKLTPLASPEPTSPRSPSDACGADDSLELVRRHESIIARKLSQQTKRRAGGRSLLRIASFIGSGGSRRPSISHSMHSMLVPSTNTEDPALPQPHKNQKYKHSQKEDADGDVDEDEDEDEDEGLSIASKTSISTAVDSTSDLSSTTGALEFYSGNSNGLHPVDPYVDPYTNNRIPDMSTRQPQTPPANTHVLDKSLLTMAGDSLKSMIGEILLDRERLEFLREGLASGGITAATIWYSFPWLHLELLQFDASRQRLISMLLSNSHTCPPDSLRVFASSLSNSGSTVGADEYEQAFIESLDSRDRDEYLHIQESVGSNTFASLSPSQVWRFIIRPVVAHDSDLFYSDYKMMAMGIARLSMVTSRKQHVQH